MLEEWSGMSRWHKVRVSISINLMVFFTLASGYAESWKIITGLLSLHYGTTVLYANNQTMIASLNQWWGNQMMITIFYDLLVYFACMFLFAYIGIKRQLFGGEKKTVAQPKPPKPIVTEYTVGKASIVEPEAEEEVDDDKKVHDAIDRLIEEK
jgi:hypothetical protein